MNCPYCLSDIPDDSLKCPVCGADISAEDLAENYSCLPLDNGSIVYYKYKIEKVLGQGGFGITYLAYDDKLERKVAIKEYFPYGIAVRTGSKVTIPPTRDNKENIENFKNEAKSIAKLKNPWIVDVYDVIEENGTLYIVMEYIEGEALSSVLGKINEKEAVKYAMQIAKAVGVIHSAGMLHQDIKPENIILKKDENIKIIDFGSSRVFTADKTKTYEKILTPGFAPLEQYGGKGKRGEYTDIYAICATLYAMLKGSPPPEVTDILGDAKAEINFDGISEGLKDVLKKGLAIKIPERIQNTSELLKLLEEFEMPKALNVPKISAPEIIKNGKSADIQINSRQNIQNNPLGQAKNIPPKKNMEANYERTPGQFIPKSNGYQHDNTVADKNAEVNDRINSNANYGVHYNNYDSKNKINMLIALAVIIFFMAVLAAAGYFIYFKFFSGSKKLKSVNSGSAKSLKKKLKSKKYSKNRKKSNGGKSLEKSNNNAYVPPATSQNNVVERRTKYRSYKKQAVKTAPIFQPRPQPDNAFVFSGSGYNEFKMSGCFYCHNIDGRGKQGGYSLSHIGSQLSYFQIENQITHPSSSMPPNPNMPAEEVAQIAGWLESLK